MYFIITFALLTTVCGLLKSDLTHERALCWSELDITSCGSLCATSIICDCNKMFKSLITDIITCPLNVHETDILLCHTKPLPFPK